MTIGAIIEILNNRIQHLLSQRTIAVQIGDIAQVVAVDAEVAQTRATIAALQTLG
jgi:hypothetical protein